MRLSSFALLSIQHRHTEKERDERGRGEGRDALVGRRADENIEDGLLKSFDYQK